MGVLMVRKEVKRRTSLLMGISLAILVGAAAAFLIVALPQSILEKLTTVSGLSHLMVQAEPPISQNDRTLLAVLAGIGTAGIGWVAIDWLLFGRVGMSAIIRQREDDYEDEGDGYRPSDPLDLVKHVPRTIIEVGPPANPNDPRRPLSARTDIGDPPKPSAPWPPARDPFDLAINPQLPPIDQLLPDVGWPSSVGPGAGAPPAMTAETPRLDIGFPPPPVFPPAAPPVTPPRTPSPLADLPGWIPPPQPAAQIHTGPVLPQPVLPPAVPERPVFEPQAPALPPLPPETAFAPVVPPQPVAPPTVAPSWSAPATPPAAAPPAYPPVATPPARPAEHPQQSVTGSAASLDRAPLGDLLARLEQGMQRRRPTTPPPVRAIQSELSAFERPRLAAAVPPTPPRPAEAAPPAPPPAPPPSFAAPPAEWSRPPEPQPAVQPVWQTGPADHAPPAPYAAAPPVSPPHWMQAEPQPQPIDRDVRPEPAAPQQQAGSAPFANGDGLLDQPLHVALDVLRNLVRR